MSRIRYAFKFMLAWRDYIITVVTPLILSLLFLYDGTEYQKPARCTFVLAILVIFWTTECLPIAVTALLPMFLYPLLKITTAKDLAPKYMSEVNMAFIGSYIMVLAFEHANLHKRFAIRILLTVGAQPRWLLFGIMMSACFLSMFTNNTMSCALHLPIVKGIVDELREASKRQSATSKQSDEEDEKNSQMAAVLAEIQYRPTMAIIAQECVQEVKRSTTSDDAFFDADDPSRNFGPRSSSVGGDEDIEMQILGESQKLVGDILEVAFINEGEKPDAVSPRIEDEAAGKALISTGGDPSKTVTTSTPGNKEQQQQDSDVLSPKVIDGIEKMLLISAAYSSSIGGMVTLIGTPTNLMMKERAEIVYDSYNCTNPVTFTSWFVFGLPIGYSFIFLAWFWLQFYYLGPKYVIEVWILEPFRRVFRRRNATKKTKAKDPATIRAERITAVIKQLYEQLEPMGFEQYAVIAHCVVLIILLITRQMTTGEGGGSNGLGWDMVAPRFTKESTATIIVSAFLFAIPSTFRSLKSSGDEIKAPKPLLTWQHVDKEFPFGVILLLGGGMAAAAGAQDSGLPSLIAPVFGGLMKQMSLGWCVLLTSVVVSALTEMMSNVACVTLICPIMENLAKEMNVNPLLFLFPTALASSFAFMLPVATPPNALVFATNRLRIIDMVLCGTGMKFGVLLIVLAATTWGNTYFSLYQPPCAH